MAKKVLVVEDDRAVAELVAMVLRDEGYEVILAGDYRQVPDAIADAHPDVVLLDSPDSRGYGPAWELALCLHQENRSIRLMMLTGHVRDALEVGVTDRGKIFASAITKPFDIDTLISQVAVIAHRSEGDLAELFSQAC